MDSTTKQSIILDYIKNKNPEKIINLPKVVTDEQVLRIYEELRGRVDKLSKRLKISYPVDLKELNTQLDSMAKVMVSKDMNNTLIAEKLYDLGCALTEHPIAKEVKANLGDRESILKIFADNHSIVMFGGKTCIRREDTQEWIIPEQLRSFYAHKEVPTIDGKPQNVVTAFMEWEQAPRYKGVVFDPTHKGHNEFYNTWTGWTVEPEEGDDDALWWEVLEAACGYNIEYVEYFTKYLAHMIQKPTEQPGTAIGIQGPQGVGKSALVETVGALMSNILSLNGSGSISGAFGDFSLDEVLAEFNEHVANKLLIYFDEATWGGSPDDAQQMKKVITKTYHTINPKFLGRITLPSYSRKIFSSNDGFYYRPDKDDRRLLPLEFDSSKINEKSYDFWKKFYKARGEGKMLNNLLFHLMSIDITDWNPGEQIKKLNIVTGAEMLESAKQPWEHWFDEVAENGFITIIDQEDTYKSELDIHVYGKEIYDKQLFDAYILWSNKHKYPIKSHSAPFKKQFRSVFGEQLRPYENKVRVLKRKVPTELEMKQILKSQTRWSV